MNRTRLAFVAAGLALVLAPLGCRRLEEKVAEKAAEKAIENANGGGKVTINGQNITMTDPNGKGSIQMGPSATVPADFPKDVPIYPGAKITMAIASNQNGKSGHAVTMSTKDTPAAVVAYYKANLKGFAETVNLSTGDSAMLGMKQASSGLEVVVNAAKSSSETVITLSAQK